MFIRIKNKQIFTLLFIACLIFIILTPLVSGFSSYTDRENPNESESIISGSESLPGYSYREISGNSENTLEWQFVVGPEQINISVLIIPEKYVKDFKFHVKMSNVDGAVKLFRCFLISEGKYKDSGFFVTDTPLNLSVIFANLGGNHDVLYINYRIDFDAIIREEVNFPNNLLSSIVLIISLIISPAVILVIVIKLWKPEVILNKRRQVQDLLKLKNLPLYCHVCGSLIDIDSIYCHECGSKQG